MDHMHTYTTQRGGKFMSGDSAAGDNLTNVKVDTPEYSHHNLSHTIRTTACPGELYPIDTITCVTGDSIKLDGNLTTMFTPTNKPFLDEWEQYLHAYFVPSRLCDPAFTQFFTGGKDGKYDKIRSCFNFRAIEHLRKMYAAYPSTQSDLNYSFDRAIDYGQILDLFNLPCGKPTTAHATTPLTSCDGSDLCTPVIFDKFMAYQRIYNDFYRMPEWETDLFLDIPETPTEVVTKCLEEVMKYTTGSGGGVASVNGYEAAYKMLSANDGYFWKFFQWMTEHPTRISVIAPAYSGSAWTSSCLWNIEFVEQNELNDSTNYVCGPGNYPNIIDFSYNSSTKKCYSNFQVNTDYSNITTSGSSSKTLYAWDTTLYNASSFNTAMADLVAAFLSLCVKPHSMCYERDRYNTLLPYTQRGVGAVLLKNIVTNSGLTSTTAQSVYKGNQVNPFTTFGDALNQTLYAARIGTANTTTGMLYSMFTKQDLKNLSADTRYLEKSARFGYRYAEYIRGIFGITADQLETEKPSYLGGLKSGVNSSRVTNMAASSVSSTGAVAIGQWSGEAGTNTNGTIGAWAAAESGVIMMIYCCKPRLTYQGINDPENHKVKDRTQLFTPDYAFIQEQIQFADELNAYNDEIFANAVNGVDGIDPASPIGNVPRYNEYRQIPSTAHGNLRNPNYADYQAFSCARDMSQFVTSYDVVEMNHCRPYDDDIQRIFQVDPEDLHPLIIEFGVGVDADRLVPAYTPTL